MGARVAEALLSGLVTREHVAASATNLALSALAFLYREADGRSRAALAQGVACSLSAIALTPLSASARLAVSSSLAVA